LNKVLIITYYWPPSGGSAVLRWLKFTKYLRDFGWEPVIYTPLNPEPQEIDESLLSDIPSNLEVVKRKIIEPYGIYKLLTGKKKNERLGVALMEEKKKKGITGKISLWIRSNLFIPDPRMLWIRPSVKFLSDYIKNHPVDAVITTGPPHSMHLIGLGLKRKSGIKWIADFRDPWTNIDFYAELSLMWFADGLHRKLEKKVLVNADHIITVSPGMTDEFRSLGAPRVITITNGFDEQDMNIGDTFTGEKFAIIHLGSLPGTRNPENLWKILAHMTRTIPAFSSDLVIRLIGQVDRSVIESLSANGLLPYTIRESYVAHNRTPEILRKSAVLLLCINNTPNAKGILTNKFFEYLASKRPIVAIGPEDGDAAYILRDTMAGEIFDYSESLKLQNHLLKLFELYSQNKLQISTTGIEKYSRRNLTKQLSALLNTL